MHQLTDKKNKIVIYLLFLLILSTTSNKFIKNKSNYSSGINKFNVEGLSTSDNSKIFNELNNIFYKNILLISKDEVNEIINKYNIIEEYSVKKVFPSTINISIKPTKFVAKIFRGKQLFIGANGKFISDKKNIEILPYIFGEFTSKSFLIFKKEIEKSKFTFSNFKIIYFFPSNRWDILTNDNILIKLPHDDISKSLNLAYKMINNSEFKNKKLIDLRIKNILILK